MSKTFEEKLAAIAADHKKVITECNKVVATAKKSELDAYAERIKGLEEDYLKVRSQQVYGECPEVIDAIKRHTFTTLSSKRETRDGVFLGYTVESSVEQIDLHEYCEYMDFETHWYYNAQAFGKRVALRVADDLGISKERVKAINNSYSMHKIAEEINLGKDPTSNSQMVKHLQAVLDELCPGTGKVNSHDVAYILYRTTKVSSKNLVAVGVAANNRIMSAIGTAFFRVATGGAYDVDFRIREGAAKAAPEQKVDEPKPQAKSSKKSSKKTPKASEPVSEVEVPKTEAKAAAGK